MESRAPLGGRPRPGGAAAPERRARAGRGALARPRSKRSPSSSRRPSPHGQSLNIRPRTGIVASRAARGDRSSSAPAKRRNPCPQCPLPVSGETHQSPRTSRDRLSFRAPTNGAAVLTQAQLDRLVRAIQAARDGDFTVRLRPEGPLAEVAAGAQRARRAQPTSDAGIRADQQGRGSRRPDQRAGEPRGRARLVGREDRRRQRADRQPRAADDRGRARDRRRRGRRPDAADPARDRRPAGAGRVPADRHDGERDGRPALLLRGRGDAGRARGRHRGQARRPGARQGRLGDLEGPDRLGQPDGLQPDGAGAEHRRRDDRGRAWATSRRR